MSSTATQLFIIFRHLPKFSGVDLDIPQEFPLKTLEAGIDLAIIMSH
jgi:hypothetical protein